MRLRDEPSAPVPYPRSWRHLGRAAFPRAALFFGLVRNHFAGLCVPGQGRSTSRDIGIPNEYVGSLPDEQPNFTQGPEMKMNMTKGLGMNTTTWRGSIYVWLNKPSAMSS